MCKAGEKSACPARIAGGGSSGHALGFVHIYGNRLMDGIILCRKVRIVLIVRVEKFQLAFIKRNTQQDRIILTGKKTFF